MIKVCSFMPAVTQMIYDMGLQAHLKGITFECPELALKEKKVVVRCILEEKNYSSLEINAIFSESKRSGKSLYYVEEPLLREIAPDIIFTQDVCDVCQIDTACAAAAISQLEKKPQLISITPNTLEDVFENALTIAKAMGKEEVGHAYITMLSTRMARVSSLLQRKKAPTRRVSLLEWISPLFNCGHWIPNQIAIAGGMDMLSNPAGDSSVLSWEKVVAYDPEVLIIAPCGFSIDRSLEEMYQLTTKEDWGQLSAVRFNTVFIVDFDLFTQSSASTLVDGIEVLAALFHSSIMKLPKRLRSRVHRFSVNSSLSKV